MKVNINDDDDVIEIGPKVYRKISDLGGSTGAILVKAINEEDEDSDSDDESNCMSLTQQNNYMVLKYLNCDQLYEEVIADHIYRTCNIPVPFTEFIVDESDHNQCVRTSAFIDGTLLLDINSRSLKSQVKKQLQEGFVIDCWLANWDVIGIEQENIIASCIDEKAYRVDNGGALSFRAQGSRKESFNYKVTELETMRDRQVNYQAARCFDSLSDNDVAVQIYHYEPFCTEALAHITDSTLTKILRGRLKYMLKWADQHILE